MIIFIQRRQREEIACGNRVQGVRFKAPDESRRQVAQYSYSGRNGAFDVMELNGSNGRELLLKRKRAKEWAHPWYTDLVWSESLKDRFGESLSPGWAAIVRPGFVNGIDPVCPQAEGVKPFTTERSFYGSGQTDQAGLLDGPLIPLSGPGFWQPTSSIPFAVKQFFNSVGLEPEVSISGGVRGNNISDISITINETRSRLGSGGGESRQFMEAHLYLAVARPSYRQENILQGDGFGGFWTDTFVSFDVLSFSRFPRPRLLAGQMPKSSNTSVPGTFNPLQSSMGDEGLDYLKVATIYAVSPASESDGFESLGSALGAFSSPGAARRGGMESIPRNWEMLVQYDLFWNVEHRSRNLVPINIRTGPVVGGGLAAFVGRWAPGVVASANMAANMGNSLISSALNTRTNEGVFWTV
jgi:hypothetical protein